MGYTATWAGMTTAWSGVCAVLMAPVAGALMAKKVDPRRLVFIGLSWIAFVMVLRTQLTNDATYWQIALPLILMGIGLPLFFVPLTALALGSVDDKETAAGAGLQNFLRTMSGAIATSLVSTAWDDKATYMHAELSGLTDSDGAAMKLLSAVSGSHDAALAQLNTMVQSQSVMIATNQLMAVVAVFFLIAALAVWLAPKPAHEFNPMQAGAH
jgi:DHA2 family multidrug resistance protein